MQPSNDLGLLAQALPIARELRDRGHRIVFCSPAKAPSRVISDAGFENHGPRWPMYSILTGDTRRTNFVRVLRSMHLKRDWEIFSWFLRHIKENSTAEIWNIDHFMHLAGMGNEEYARAAVETLSQMIAGLEPDAVVNFWNPLMSIAAKINRKPLISVIQSDLHPLSRGFIWWKEAPADLPTPVRTINKLLAENHLPEINSMADLSLGDLTLVPGIREIEPLPDSADVRYVGPLFLQGRNEQRPEWLDRLRKDQPVIWIYPGNLRYIKDHDSPFDGMVILKACIEALRDMAVQVILSTGHQALPKDTLPLPSNFRHYAFVPGRAMAERSDLIIHHGGYGSCQTGLDAGTPALVIPTYSERESNARRIAAAGAGDFMIPAANASGRKKTLPAEELRAKIVQMLSNPSYKENAKKISEIMKRYGGASEAASLIERLLRRERPRIESRIQR